MIWPYDRVMRTDSSRHVHVQAHSLGCHLDVPSISYALALLRLPQLFMATYFVRGVETFSELAISLRRLNAFLALPEPPAPAHLQGTEAGKDDVEILHRDNKVRCENVSSITCWVPACQHAPWQPWASHASQTSVAIFW